MFVNEYLTKIDKHSSLFFILMNIIKDISKNVSLTDWLYFFIGGL